MRSLLTLSGTSKAKWFVVAFWVAVFFGLNAVNIFDKYADAEQNRSVDYLPSGAESVDVIDTVADFPSGERFTAVVVYRRDGGLTAADRALVVKDRAELMDVATAGRPPAPVFSRDGTTALTFVPFKVTGEGEIVTRDVDGVREAVAGAPPGLESRSPGLPATPPTRSTSSTRSTGPWWRRRRCSSSFS